MPVPICCCIVAIRLQNTLLASNMGGGKTFTFPRTIQPLPPNKGIAAQGVAAAAFFVIVVAAGVPGAEGTAA